ncbi:MAG: response regulator [Pseudomonadota bacterium]
MNQIPQLLLVDDDERLLRSLRVLLTPHYEVYTATDGAKAIDILQHQSIDVIVSDQVMPVMEGVELLRLARRISPNTVRLLLTGYADLAAIVGSVNEGEIFHYINKPWDNEEILSIVASAVDTAQREKTLGHIEPAQAQAPLESSQTHLLVNDNKQDTLQTCRALFGNEHEIHSAHSFEETLEIIAREPVSILLTEVHLNHTSIEDHLDTLREQYPTLVIMIMTEFHDVELLIELINEGRIFRFLSKPVRRSVLEISVKAAFKRHQHLKLMGETEGNDAETPD